MIKEVGETTKNSSSIRIKNTTKRRVEKLGDLGDTWDTLLNDMASYIEDNLEDWFEEEEDPESDAS
jgi:hypothetical protein